MENNTVIKENAITNYRAAQDLHQQTLRQGILDDASNLLMGEGPTALSMRRVAQLVGCSTTVLYTMFGSKQGLIDELYLRGFDMLRQAIESVPNPDNPREYILALCYACRNFALANPAYYSVMFLKVIPEYTPSDANRWLGIESFKLLVQAVQDCTIPESTITSEAWETARIIWATFHGHVALELVGYFNVCEPPLPRFERGLQALIDGLLPR
jgi:AcrR family transcriptional regulator